MRTLLAALSLLMSGALFAHGGGLDKKGCHTNHKTGEYHCHRGPASPHAQAKPETFEELRKRQPQPVAELMDRIAGCNHWLGEEAYDANRAKQITDAAEKLQCRQLDTDEAKIKKQYNSPDVKKALDAAKEE